jgi:hypothetical protein
MFRKAIRVTAILAATLAIPATVLTAAPSANASGSRLCETNASNNYCLGSADTSLYTSIVTKSTGRNLNLTPLGFDYLGYPVYLLQFSSVAADCVGVSNDVSHVEIKPCNGGTGIDWARERVSSGQIYFINRYATEHVNDGKAQFLTGKNTADTPFFTADPGACCGDYQVFEWKS